MTGIVFDIKECSVHDGPGMRTTVFLKGCPLRCIWCHNPEGLQKEPCIMVKHTFCQNCGLCKRGCNHPDCRSFDRCIHTCPNGAISVSGKEYTPKELANIVMKNKIFFDTSKGGVTFSGGEPLMQFDFMSEAIDLMDTHIAVETSGFSDSDTFKKMVEKVDCVIMDIKLYDENLHKRFTGVSNKQILENAEILKKSGKEHIFRTPLIPKITDTKENLDAIQKITKGSVWEKIPYNNLAGLKYPMVGKEYEYDNYIKREDEKNGIEG